jgi:hypothetical protein
VQTSVLDLLFILLYMGNMEKLSDSLDQDVFETMAGIPSTSLLSPFLLQHRHPIEFSSVQPKKKTHGAGSGELRGWFI